MVSVYGFYHGKSTCFTTIWKNMFDSLFPTTLAKKIWKYLVRKSINQPEWWFFWNFLPNRSVQPVVAFGWRLGNETNEVLFITANQPSPEPPPQTYPAGNKALLRAYWVWGVGWLAMISWLGNGDWNFTIHKKHWERLKDVKVLDMKDYATCHYHCQHDNHCHDDQHWKWSMHSQHGLWD